ncbi:puromycin-sensitive aminopeptidase-like isoform X2 [Belonocnema kinseyi]|uniref:puromycin-sensitive aminopeptidase-like isoform X2 n=1 Tax=Belonocnema kinseyi TaxID=2817044 RepID=UPI00143CFE99|nr:puromycin-sensitive aminopeptidase-like isoform X2 [Belonocnema kinseyi]
MGRGEQHVHIKVHHSTNEVTLNSVDINIKHVTFHNANGNIISSTEIVMNPTEETAKILFPETLPIGKIGYLHLEFQGEINDKLKGLYRSKYTGTDAKITYAAVTQFAPIDARRCFPCWDEPILKATFDMSLKIPNDLIAVSNMPLKSKTTSDDTVTWTFETTPIMSTYLLAFVVGKFDHVECKTTEGTLVRAYTPKSKSHLGQFALDIATKIIPYYNQYFKISYPLPKLDLIPVAEMSFGGMENWGHITFREICLLVDPENTSAIRKQRIALIIGHEIAHQWFGNLVTMKWWDDLWLNEGYSSFIEFLCVDHLFPEYDIWTHFVTRTYIPALELDALKNTHPIQIPINQPSEIDEIFDEISYNKAASIIRMLHSYIGEEDFKKGMNLYLKKFSYANAQTEDLWAALEEVSSKSVASIMPTWTKQEGFPILDVKHHWQENDLVLTFSQKRFVADGSTDPANNLWMIPLQITSAQSLGKVIFSSVIDERKAEFLLKNISKNTWIKVNPGTIGFYRTRYSSDLLELLVPAIKKRELPALDRLGILDDMIAFAQAGQTSTVEVLKLLQAFQAEVNTTVWSNIVSCLDKIGLLVENLDFESSFKSFGRSLLRDVSSRLGWEPKPGENHLNTILRPCIFERMVFLDDEEIIKEAKKKFELHLSGKNVLVPDLKNTVYKAVLANGNEDTLVTMLRLYREADLQEEKFRILSAMGTVKKEALISRVLNFIISDEVLAGDAVYAFSSITTHYKGRFLVWKFFKDNWNLFLERYQGGVLLSKLVKCVTEKFVFEDKAREIEEFFENKPKDSIERAILQGVESVRLNSSWLNRDREAIKKFLSSQS